MNASSSTTARGPRLAMASLPGQHTLALLWANRQGRLGLVLIGLHLLLAVAGRWLAPHDISAGDSLASLLPPSAEHWLGTDQLGRDVLSRTLAGGREAIYTSLPAAVLAVVWGSACGMLLAIIGGRVENIAMRLVDALLSIPWLLFLLLVIGVMGPGPLVFILTLGIFYGVAVVRVMVTACREVLCLDYIQAARLRGDSLMRLLWREIKPNVLDTILVELAMRWSWALLAFSSLSFLGFGVSPPTPDWGLMVADGRGFMSFAPWAVLPPIVALSSLIIAINLVADTLAKTLGIDRAGRPE
ncbi:MULTISPECIES: ABC transporter permease [Cobetia]|uniref:ABC transporter permease n=1 Tax=Cobetia TaxID=204286 RepID=UPI0020C0E70E|nr:ABC transporter permease [Cobetia sp. 1CM21F]MCK8067766.1 ABC transporter permease [Cobetia sp. 1CM21F]